MFPVNFSLRLSLLLMVSFSCLLIGLSQEDFALALIGILGSMLAFVVVDWLGKFALRGWLANVTSIVVLLIAMQGFFEGDGATKLVCVSKLLVYLQIVLMFQTKNRRRNWQIMILSLLEVVVAAIFNLEFEGGLLFVIWFGIAGMTMMLQSFLTTNTMVVDTNRNAAARIPGVDGAVDPQKPPRSLGGWVQSILGFSATAVDRSQPVSIVEAKTRKRGWLSGIVGHLSVALVACLTFAFLLFFFIPRNSDAWFGPLIVKVTGTGMTRKVDLTQKGKIEQTGERVFRVIVTDSLLKQRIAFTSPPYFRGMALGTLKVEDGKSTWSAPYDRVYPSVYRKLQSIRPTSLRVLQNFQMNPTDDPLLFSAMPCYKSETTPSAVEFCHEISALTRRRDNDTVEKSVFKYNLLTLVDKENAQLEAWPYVALGAGPNARLDESPGDYQWLTDLEPERYPTVVSKAEELAAPFSDDQRYLILKRLEQHFQLNQQFTYTLDFTDVDWNDDVDPIEDFYARHQCGHCELYASALAVMIRSRGIPARLVVGYFSGSYDDQEKHYTVRSDDAHAWVEAYLRPEDCPEEFFENGAAGAGGAWLRLDPTPATAIESQNVEESTIEKARDLWQEYVMGLDSAEGLGGSSSNAIMGWLDLSTWNARFERVSGELNQRPLVLLLVLLATLIAVVLGVLRTVVRSRKKKSPRGRRNVGTIRRLVGSALGLISPGLKRWVIGDDPMEVSTVFYRRLTSILESAGHKREPAQTHREFAEQVNESYTSHPQAETISGVISRVTDLFYRVRFGGDDLPGEQREEVMKSIGELESAISRSRMAAS